MFFIEFLEIIKLHENLSIPSLFLHLAAIRCWGWWGKGEWVSGRNPDCYRLNVQLTGPIMLQQGLYVLSPVSPDSLKV